MEFKYRDVYKYCHNACLNLTDACNLACRYCFVEQQPHFMTLDVAKDSVKFLVNNLHHLYDLDDSQPEQNINISYFGGEPTLLFDEIIIPLTIWCKEQYDDLIKFNMTTNGTLLNKERLDFMKEYDIKPHLSIDGAPLTQNYNRPCRDPQLKSADLVIKNIPLILEYFPQTCFRATIAEETVSETFNNYLFAIFCGFKNIFMMPDGRHKWSTQAIQELDNQFGKIYGFLLNEFKKEHLPPINFDPINKSFSNVLKHDINVLQGIKGKQNISRTPIHCGLGTSGCSIGYDGTVYGCQEQTSQLTSNLFKIGDIYNGINPILHEKLLQLYCEKHTTLCEDEKLCETCKLQTVCDSFACPSTSWSLFNNLNTAPISYCMWQKILFHYAAQLLNILTEENNLTFKEYLDNSCAYKDYFKGDN